MPEIIILPHATLCPDGALLVAEEGHSLCEVLLSNDIPIEHACEKVCACTTCHVIVQEGANSINAADELEDDMLDRAWGLTSCSRLSCQVIIGAQPLVIEIPRYTINIVREGG